jgi:SAM-dependent methyltransferase
MNLSLLDHLGCPCCHAPLAVDGPKSSSGEAIESGTLASPCGKTFPVVDGIPRFVHSSNYADTFGWQWNRFRNTQLDSHSGVPISRNRFVEYTRWSPADLAGRSVLDVGCGAGRFTEIALQAGARVVALDYSNAVDACRANLGERAELDVIQGDIFALPFRPGQFDFVYCFGVLQHTPDVGAAFQALPPQLRCGGKLAIDVYPRLLRNLLWSKYWLRPVTRRIDPSTLFRLIEQFTPGMLRISRMLRRIPVVGRGLRYLLPVVDYTGVYPLSEQQLREWAILDTFDMLAPAHDHPQAMSTVRTWLRDAGLVEVSVERLGFFVARGTRGC